MKRMILSTAAAVLLAGAGVSFALARDDNIVSGPATEQKAMHKIRLTVGAKTFSATLFDNPTARDFATLLPFEADMHDLFRQEKAGRTPRALSTSGPAQRYFSAGDIGYWSPSADVAIYYRKGDGLPSPGIIMVGKIDGDVSLMDAPGNVRVKFARVD